MLNNVLKKHHKTWQEVDSSITPGEHMEQKVVLILLNIWQTHNVQEQHLPLLQHLIAIKKLAWENQDMQHLTQVQTIALHALQENLMDLFLLLLWWRLLQIWYKESVRFVLTLLQLINLLLKMMQPTTCIRLVVMSLHKQHKMLFVTWKIRQLVSKILLSKQVEPKHTHVDLKIVTGCKSVKFTLPMLPVQDSTSIH